MICKSQELAGQRLRPSGHRLRPYTASLIGNVNYCV